MEYLIYWELKCILSKQSFHTVCKDLFQNLIHTCDGNSKNDLFQNLIHTCDGNSKNGILNTRLVKVALHLLSIIMLKVH